MNQFNTKWPMQSQESTDHFEGINDFTKTPSKIKRAKEKKKKKKLVPLIILLLKTNRYFCSPQQLGRQPYFKAIPLLREIFTSHVFVFVRKKKQL